MQDRIEKNIDIAAPIDRVWRAISEAEEFGSWFGVAFETPFAAGETSWGRITDPPGMAHLRFAFRVVALEPYRFAYEWHPYAIDPDVDYSAETPTLVAFTLTPIDTGTRLDLVESGFAALPPQRYADAVRMNTSGWETQLERVRACAER